MTDAPVFVVAAMTRRVVDVWMPVIEALLTAGARIELLTFPRRADPDHQGLADLPFDVRLSAAPPIFDETFPIRDDLPALAALNARLVQSFADRPAHAILCCTANITPENQVRSALADLPGRPMVVGLQHGFVQWWPSYSARFDYDLFGVMGPAFLDRFKPDQRDRVVALGMTELARMDHATPLGDRLLFAAQQEPGAEIVGPLLAGLAPRLGLSPLIRRHPEHRQAFDALAGRIAFSQAATIEDDLSRSAVVVSTGSTSVLKALAMGRRVIVLPQQGGEIFAPLGVVVAQPTVEAALAVLKRQDHVDFARARDAFLAEHCGPLGPDAADRAAETLLGAARAFRQQGLQTRPYG